MPRVNKRAKRRKSGYTTWHIYFLRAGHDFGLGAGFDDPKRQNPFDESYDIEAVKEAWEIFRDELVLDWILMDVDEDHRGGPFSRPWAWWRIDAPCRRERIDGGIHPHDNPEWQAQADENESLYPGHKAWVSRLWYGVPSVHGSLDEYSAEYESERDYLIRHDLLTDYERQLLAEEAPK